MTTPGPPTASPDESPDQGPDELLAEATQARVRAGALDQRVDAARERLRSREAEAERLKARLGEEERDVTRLESLSWSRTLSTLRGSRSSDLEREQAERDAARHAVGVADDRVRADRAELDSLLARRAELGDVGAAHAAALAAKEEWLAARDPALASRLHEIADERGRLAAEDHESRQAFTAGQQAFRHLSDASATLGDARSWASWDTFGGGGMFTDAMKYDRLDQVGQDLRQADAALRTFTNELADVHLPAVQALELDGLTTTFDVWFDNVFSDWAVRERIVQAQGRVDEALAQVTAALDRLGARGHEIRARLGALAEERARLLG